MAGDTRTAVRAGAQPAGPFRPHTRHGRHFLVELTGCDADVLRRVDPLREVMLDAAARSGATVVGFAFHQFHPHGASGTLLISESHFALHSWPEDRYLAMDVFTCGEEMDAGLAIEAVKEGVGAQHVHVREFERGC